MRKIFMFGVLLLLLAACSGTVVSEQGVEEKSETSTVEESADEKVSSLDQLKEETESKNDATKNLVVPIAIVKSGVGKTAIFGTMINRANLQKGLYFMKVTFVEARDANYNRIEVDKQLIKTWTKQETNNFELEDSLFVPITINVGNEVGSGASTIPGTYQFELELFKRVDATFDTEVSGAIKQIYLKVK